MSIGNYVISGGTETVLVLWQLDTGKQQFLPHLSATIQNVVVSPTGASYAVQLDDNSAMILSTAELQPTANISGIQLPVVEVEEAIDSQVRKLEGSTWLKPLVQRTPAVVNPVQPSQLLLGVGQSQGIRPTKPKKMSNSFLETFDLGAGHNIYRQALARTNITNVDAAPGAQRLNEPRVTHIKISHDGQWLATIDEWIPPVGDIDFLKHGRKSLLEEQRHRREVFLKFWQWNKEGANWELASRVNAPHNSGQETGDAGRILDLAVDPNQPRFSTIGEDGIVRTWIPKTRKRDGIIVRGKDKRPLKIWFCQHAVFLGKTELADSSSSDRNAIPSTGLVAFSEDSSLLAAACSNDEGLIHLISPDSGTVRSLHTGLFDNEIFGLQILGQDLIILSSNLLVFDLVSQELRYGLKLKPNVSSLSIEQKQEMMHLAIDERSHTFALALPRFSDPEIKGTEQNLWQAVSELLVFAHDSTEPQLNEVFPSIISALIPSVGSEGFLVLDTNAEVRTVGKKGSQPITALAQSTSALQLDSVSEEPEEGVLLRLVEGPEDIEQDQLPIPNATQTEEQNEDAETPVVTQQQLAQVFDIGPAFALPPVEEMFYQVAGLFSSKPKPVS
jgi:NET1-associated nuclear protein 1 (U3 small nucleolar RNA-associated protein 17)